MDPALMTLSVPLTALRSVCRRVQACSAVMTDECSLVAATRGEAIIPKSR
jgi:hypothetical protein